MNDIKLPIIMSQLSEKEIAFIYKLEINKGRNNAFTLRGKQFVHAVLCKSKMEYSELIEFINPEPECQRNLKVDNIKLIKKDRWDSSFSTNFVEKETFEQIINNLNPDFIFYKESPICLKFDLDSLKKEIVGEYDESNIYSGFYNEDERHFKDFGYTTLTCNDFEKYTSALFSCVEEDLKTWNSLVDNLVLPETIRFYELPTKQGTFEYRENLWNLRCDPDCLKEIVLNNIILANTDLIFEKYSKIDNELKEKMSSKIANIKAELEASVSYKNLSDVKKLKYLKETYIEDDIELMNYFFFYYRGDGIAKKPNKDFERDKRLKELLEI